MNSKLKERIKIGAATVILSVGIMAGPKQEAQAATVTATAKAPAWSQMLPESMRFKCRNEDSYNCYWDASVAGNGKGHSFVIRHFKQGNLTCRMYVNKADADKWDHCWKGVYEK